MNVVTEDGSRLVVHPYPAHPDVRPKPHPVVLVHGLGASARAWSFPGRSVVEYLTKQGFECFAVDLRGAGESTPAEAAYDFDDYLIEDMPAVLDAVLEQTGADKVHWVGHSMGGVLLMCFAIRHGADAPIASGICIGSGLDYSVHPTDFDALRKLRPVMERMKRVPFGGAMKLLSPLFGRFGTSLERFNFHPPNVEPQIIRDVHRTVFGSIPTKLLLSLATTYDEGGLQSRDGFRYLDEVENACVPIYLIGGTEDRQCPPPVVEATGQLLGDACKDVEVFEDYGHFDLLVGRNVASEVWPTLAGWLGQNLN